MELYDVIIIGGGPAGLNAAVVLGRSRRKVLVFDNGQQRNIRSEGMHNYLTRDNIKPAEFIRIAREEAFRFNVLFRDIKAKSVTRQPKNRFRVTDEEGTSYLSKKILFSSGLVDILPQIEGFQELYGKSVFHCPYCDGWEVKDRKLAVYAKSKNGTDLAVALKSWSEDVSLFTDGNKKLKPEDREILQRYDISVHTSPLEKLEGHRGQLKNVVMKDGSKHPCDALSFVNGYDQHSSLAEKLGCVLNAKKVVQTNRLQQSNIPGVYVAGDASRDMHFVIVAAAEGAKAGVTINKELQKEEKEKLLNQKRKNLRN
jgi:thioredoxin reductase